MPFDGQCWFNQSDPNRELVNFTVWYLLNCRKTYCNSSNAHATTTALSRFALLFLSSFRYHFFSSAAREPMQTIRRNGRAHIFSIFEMAVSVAQTMSEKIKLYLEPKYLPAYIIKMENIFAHRNDGVRRKRRKIDDTPSTRRFNEMSLSPTSRSRDRKKNTRRTQILLFLSWFSSRRSTTRYPRPVDPPLVPSIDIFWMHLDLSSPKIVDDDDDEADDSVQPTRV